MPVFARALISEEGACKLSWLCPRISVV